MLYVVAAIKQKLYLLPVTEKEELWEKIKLFLESHKEILFAYLHGSLLAEKNFRDIDLALYTDKREIPALDYELELEVSLHEAFHLPFDVCLLNNCPPSFAYRAIKEGERVYVRDDEKTTTFEEATLSHYLDFLPYHKLYMIEG